MEAISPTAEEFKEIVIKDVKRQLDEDSQDYRVLTAPHNRDRWINTLRAVILDVQSQMAIADSEVAKAHAESYELDTHEAKAEYFRIRAEKSAWKAKMLKFLSYLESKKEEVQGLYTDDDSANHLEMLKRLVDAVNAHQRAMGDDGEDEDFALYRIASEINDKIR